MEKEQDFKKPEYYENRELSWLKFNGRVLNEARDKSIPLLERLKFISITSSNLDEFFMVRVAYLIDMVHADYKKTDIAGMTATEQLEKINVATRELVELQYSTYNRSLVPQLEAKGIRIIDAFEELTAEQQEFVDKYFEETVYPVLTPMAVDASRPFPLIRNKTLNIATFLLKKGEKKKEENYEFATVQVPGVLPRIIPIPDGENHSFILLEQIIEKNMERLFLNYDVICAYPYRIMRNADLTIDEDEAEDLLQEIQKQLKKRQWGEIIRLEVEDKIDKKLLHFLKEELQIPKDDIYKINGPLDLTFLMKVYGMEGCDDLRYDNAHADAGSQQVQVPDVGCEWDLTNDHHDDGDGQYEHELYEGHINERKCFFEALNACQNAGAAKRRKKNPKRCHGSVFRRAIDGVSSRILAQGRHKDTADPLHF